MALCIQIRFKHSKDSFNEKHVKKICFSIKNMIKLIEKNRTFFVTNLGHKLWSDKKCKFIPFSSEMG